ncbi:MAG TPA: TetR/AcrR family transcriptional regulator [Mucilaginibacter sp.]
MREEILEAALKQFLENGIRKITVKEIIAPLGISTKTIYKYFKDKETLLEACLDLHYGRLHEGMQSTAAEYDNPLILMFRMLIKGFELDFTINPAFYHDLNHYYPELQDKAIQKNFTVLTSPVSTVLADAIQLGLIRAGLDARVVQAAIGVLYKSVTRSAEYAGFGLSPFEIAANTMEVYLRGLCTAEGLRQLELNKELTSFNYKP